MKEFVEENEGLLAFEFYKKKDQVESFDYNVVLCASEDNFREEEEMDGSASDAIQDSKYEDNFREEEEMDGSVSGAIQDSEDEVNVTETILIHKEFIVWSVKVDQVRMGILRKSQRSDLDIGIGKDVVIFDNRIAPEERMVDGNLEFTGFDWSPQDSKAL
ncbi:unnamed protein product [Ilex paraguariensis]|uniref:Uncharacterized protein n=1 Tax=Ilex paraguariensis TaxID=185542 RepID=A0ABC8SCF7_9AQUA